MSSTYLIFLFK